MVFLGDAAKLLGVLELLLRSQLAVSDVFVFREARNL